MWLESSGGGGEAGLPHSGFLVHPRDRIHHMGSCEDAFPDYIPEEQFLHLHWGPPKLCLAGAELGHCHRYLLFPRKPNCL